MLKATLDRYDFASGEFGRVVTFNIYDEAEQKYSLTGYTVYFLGLTYSKSETLEITTTPDPDQVNNKGKGTFQLSSTGTLGIKGLRWIRFRLEKAGEKTYSEAIKIFVH